MDARMLRRRFAIAAGLFALPALAQAQTWVAFMNGANEVGPVVTPATGFATVTLNNHLLTVTMTWQGLIGGNPSAAHIHCCTAPGTNTGVAVGFTGFPTATSGSYTGTFNLQTSAVYTTTFVNGNGGTASSAEAALVAGLNAGNAYTNIHNTANPGGEIRGLLVVAPEPSSVALMAAGLFFVAVATTRKRRARIG